MPFLRQKSGEQRGQCIDLNSDEFVIGRLQNCQLIFTTKEISKHHAKISKKDDSYFVEDLHSRNYTYLNEEKLAPHAPRRLSNGDRIRICEIEFDYCDQTEEGVNSGEDPVIEVTSGAEGAMVHTLDASSSATTSGLSAAVRVSPQRKLDAIIDISRRLTTDLEIGVVAPKVLETLFGLFPTAERAFFILKDSQGRLVRKAFKHRNPVNRYNSGVRGQSVADEPPMSLSHSIVNLVMERKQAVLSEDASNDVNLPVSASIADLKIRSVMCAPLLTPDEQALGIIQLDTTSAQQFRQEDLDLLATVACQAAISVQNARMHEDLVRDARVKRDLKIAEQVQRDFLPKATPKVPGYEFFAYYQAAYNVGGDYYDFVSLPDGRLAITLADVAGKGIPAALMMAKFSGHTRYSILAEKTPGAAAGRLNDLLCEAELEERFITLSLMVLDPNADQITVCSAGHLPLFIRRATGVIDTIGEDGLAGFPLGIMPRSQYREQVVSLSQGDVVIVYSDGITDAQNVKEELFHSVESPRLYQSIQELKGSPTAIGKGILQHIREFSVGQPLQADDMSIVCFGRV